jgi:tetratricopeptide (TPR) repeat protein
MSARTPAHPPLPTPVPSATRRAADFLARADVLRTAGRLRQAAECYRQAIAYDGSRSAAHLGLGLALWEMGRRAEAIARLEEAVALDPRGHEPARALADAYAQCGHAGAAVKYYRQAEAADPSGGPVRTRAVRRPSVKRAVVW